VRNSRSHNPAAAYHVELMWLAGSGKLFKFNMLTGLILIPFLGKVIDSAIQSWARQVANYGLRLVEVSTREVDSKFNPFQDVAVVEMCVLPPYTEDDLLDDE
jgi:hypothetical protein